MADRDGPLLEWLRKRRTPISAGQLARQERLMPSPLPPRPARHAYTWLCRLERAGELRRVRYTASWGATWEVVP